MKVCYSTNQNLYLLREFAMKAAEIKNLLYAKLQEQVAILEKRREQNSAKMQKLIHEGEQILTEMQALRNATGVDIIFKDSTPNKVVTSEEEPQARRPQKKSKKPSAPKKIVRKRRKRKPGQPTITSVLDTCVAGVVKIVGAKGKEFSSRDVLEHMEKTGLPDKRIKLSNVSIYLIEKKKQLGIRPERRMEKGKGPIPVVKNFFKISRRRAKA